MVIVEPLIAVAVPPTIGWPLPVMSGLFCNFCFAHPRIIPARLNGVVEEANLAPFIIARWPVSFELELESVVANAGTAVANAPNVSNPIMKAVRPRFERIDID